MQISRWPLHKQIDKGHEHMTATRYEISSLRQWKVSASCWRIAFRSFVWTREQTSVTPWFETMSEADLGEFPWILWNRDGWDVEFFFVENTENMNTTQEFFLFFSLCERPNNLQIKVWKVCYSDCTECVNADSAHWLRSLRGHNSSLFGPDTCRRTNPHLRAKIVGWHGHDGSRTKNERVVGNASVHTSSTRNLAPGTQPLHICVPMILVIRVGLVLIVNKIM